MAKWIHELNQLNIFYLDFIVFYDPSPLPHLKENFLNDSTITGYATSHSSLSNSEFHDMSKWCYFVCVCVCGVMLLFCCLFKTKKTREKVMALSDTTWQQQHCTPKHIIYNGLRHATIVFRFVKQSTAHTGVWDSVSNVSETAMRNR